MFCVFFIFLFLYKDLYENSPLSDWVSQDRLEMNYMDILLKLIFGLGELLFCYFLIWRPTRYGKAIKFVTSGTNASLFLFLLLKQFLFWILVAGTVNSNVRLTSVLLYKSVLDKPSPPFAKFLLFYCPFVWFYLQWLWLALVIQKLLIFCVVDIWQSPIVMCISMF